MLDPYERKQDLERMEQQEFNDRVLNASPFKNTVKQHGTF
jgi:hypothetical protein